MTAVHRGVVFPQGSIPGDPDAVREYVERIVAVGYDHLVVPDHVLGVDPGAHPGWQGVYTVADTFHELLVLFGFLAGFCDLELVAGVLVLPQRQAVVVAKQAADVDLLSRGRLRLGVGVGWNAPEFEGLGADFAGRGDQLDEQVELLRALWTSRVVNFGDGDFERARAEIAGWSRLGATHIAVNSRYGAGQSVDDHLALAGRTMNLW